VALSGEIQFASVQYLANDQVIASSTTAPFSAIWSNAPAGDYALIAEGAESNSGGYWTSNPVAISVVTNQTVTNMVVAPMLVNVGSGNGVLSFQMKTAPGVSYQVESSDSIVSPDWQPVEVIVGDGSPVVLSVSSTDFPQKYYRVRVQ
jgi:hypothetical protein